MWALTIGFSVSGVPCSAALFRGCPGSLQCAVGTSLDGDVGESVYTVLCDACGKLKFEKCVAKSTDHGDHIEDKFECDFIGRARHPWATQKETGT